MTEMTRDQWKRFIEQWQTAGSALAHLHREQIRGREHDAAAVDDLLQIGDAHTHSRSSSGLVELERWLMKLASVQDRGFGG